MKIKKKRDSGREESLQETGIRREKIAGMSKGVNGERENGKRERYMERAYVRERRYNEGEYGGKRGRIAGAARERGY